MDDERVGCPGCQVAGAGVRAIRAPWIDRYGDATAGALIVCVGAAMAALGI